MIFSEKIHQTNKPTNKLFKSQNQKPNSAKMKTIIAFAALLSVACAVPAYGPSIISAPIVTRSYAAPLIAAPAPIIAKSYAAPVIAAPIITKSYAAPVIAAPAPIITKSYAAPLISAPLISRGYASSYIAAPVISKSYASPVLLGGKGWGW